VGGVRADMNHRVSLKGLVQPEVEGQILVMRRQGDVVITLQCPDPSRASAAARTTDAPALRGENEERLAGASRQTMVWLCSGSPIGVIWARKLAGN